MPLLLEDLAEDAASGLGRTAERFDAAVKELARPDATGDEVARFARRATAYALAELPRAEALWKWETDQPRAEPSDAPTERRLLSLRAVFATQARLCAIAQGAWKRAEALGAAPEGSDELRAARWRFERLAHHTTTTLDHRKHGGQPKDPERYEEAMRQLAARAPKFLTAEEALAHLRAKQSAPAEG